MKYFSLLHEAMNNYNETQHSPYHPTKLGVHSILRSEADLVSQSGLNSKKTISSDTIVHFIEEENIVTWGDFGCGITLYPEAPTKTDRPTDNGKTFPDPVKNPSASQVTIKITVLLMRTIPLISF